MPPDAEDIPEIPPSPQQLSIQLYSIVDVEHLWSNSGFELDFAPSLGSPVFPSLDRRLSERETPECPPQPHQLSIGLYSFAEVQQLQLPIFEHLAEIPVVPPSPQQLSVGLYCLPDVQQINGDAEERNTLKDIPEIPASPRQISVDLYPVNEVESLISGDMTRSSLGILQSVAELEPSSDSRTRDDGASNVQQLVRYGELSEGLILLAVQEIVQACEGIKVYKHRSKLLSAKSEQILDAFNDITSNLQGSLLPQFTDELVRLLEGVSRITKQYSNYNAVETFLNSTKIKEGLDQCESLLRDAQTLCLQVESTVNQPPNSPTIERQEMTPEELGEQRDLLLDILSLKPADLRQQIDAVEDLSKTDAATQLAAAGREELRRLRVKSTDSGASGSQDTQSPTQIPHGEVYIQFKRGLMNLYRVTGILPTQISLNEDVEQTSGAPVAGRTYGRDRGLGKKKLL